VHVFAPNYGAMAAATLDLAGANPRVCSEGNVQQVGALPTGTMRFSAADQRHLVR
jgi:hypothetical protein